MENKFYRSKKERAIGGVCGGLGVYFRIDPVWVRLIFVVSFFLLAAFPLLLYIVLWIVTPENPDEPAPETPAAGDKTAQAGENAVQAGPKPETKSRSVVVSVIIAVALILLGLFILFPNTFIGIKDIIQICVALFLLAGAGKLFYEMFRDKNYSMLLAGMGTVILTLSAFLVFNTLRLLGYGVVWTYGKLLFPAALIIGGIALVFNSLKDRTEAVKLSASLITIGILVFLAVFSVMRSGDDKTFTLLGACPFFRGGADRFQPWSGRNFWNAQGGFGESEQQVGIPTDTAGIDYRIDNSAGQLKIDSGGEFKYFYAGAVPDIATDFSTNTKLWKVTFGSKASGARLQLPGNYPGTLELVSKAGNVDADLHELRITNADITVQAANCNIEVPATLRRLKLDVQMGNARVELPGSVDVVIRASTSLGDTRMPDGYEYRDGAYRYDGPGTDVLEIDSSVNMGNIRFRQDR